MRTISDVEIDRLQVDIEANAHNAKKSIDGLIDNLVRLDKTLGAFSNSTKVIDSLSGISSGFKGIQNAIGALNNGELKEKAKTLNSITKSIQRLNSTLQDADFSKAGARMRVLEQESKRLGETFAKSYNIDDVDVINKMTKSFYGLGKAQSKLAEGNALGNKGMTSEASREFTRTWDGLYDTIARNGKFVDESRQSYQGLLEAIQAVNSSGNKVHLPFKSSEFPGDFKSMRATLGKAFTTAPGGVDFEKWLQELNSSIGHTIDITGNAADEFNHLVDTVKRAKSEMISFSEMDRQSGGMAGSGLGSDIVEKTSPMLRKLEEMKLGEMKGGNDIAGVENIRRSLESLGTINLPDAEELRGLASALGKFGSKSVLRAADTLPKISSSIKNFSDVTVPNGHEIAAVGLGIAKFGGKNATKAVENLPTIATHIKQFAEVQIPDAERIANFATAVGRFGTKNCGRAVQNIPGLAKGLRQFRGVKMPKGTETLELAQALSKFGTKASERAANNIPKLEKGLSALFATMSKVPKVREDTIRFTEALAKLSANGSKVGTSAKYLSKNLDKTGSSAKRAKKHFHGLAATFGKFYANYFLLIRAGHALGKSVTLAMDYVETLNYFESAFGQVASKAVDSWKEAGYESAEAYSDSFFERAKGLTEKMSGFKIADSGQLIPGSAKSLGMDPAKLMNYQAVFGQMSSSMGVTSETALKLSNALTMIGADLASVKNMDFDKVWMDMQSGLAGMSRTLDKYGTNIRNVNMEEKLHALGIAGNIEKMNQNEKALLRTYILLDSTRYAWGDLALTINQPANQLRLLKASFTNLGRTIGELFIPILQKVIPVITSVTNALQRLFHYIGNLLGIKFSGTKGGKGGAGVFNFGEDADAINDTADGAGVLGNKLGNATKKAKELKYHLLSIDELNVLNKEDYDTPFDEGLGNGNGGAGVGAPDMSLLENALDDILDEYQTAWDKAFDEMEERSNQFADNVAAAFRSGGLYGVGQYFANSIKEELNSIDWPYVYESVANFGEGLANFLNGLINPEMFYAVGRTIAGALNTALTFFFSVGDTFDFTNLGLALAQGVNGALDNFDFGLLAKTLSTWVIGLKDALVAFIFNIKWSDAFKGIWDFLRNVKIEAVEVVIGAFIIKKVIKAIVAGGVMTFLGAAITNPIVLAVGGAFMAIGGFVSMLTDGWTMLKEVIMTVGFILGGIVAVMMGASAPVVFVIGTIIWAITSLIGVVIGGWDELKADGEAILAWIDEKTEPIREKIGEIWGLIKEKARDVKDFILAIPENIKEKWAEFKGWIEEKKEWFKEKATALKEWFEEHILDPLGLDWEDMGTIISDTFGAAWDSIIDRWNNSDFKKYVVDPIADAFSIGCDGIEIDFENLWKGILNGAIWAFNQVIWAVENAVNFVLDAINWAIEGINSAIEGANDVLGTSWNGIPTFGDVSLPRIPYFEAGGFPDKGSLFWAGEHGTPELMGTVGGHTAVASGAEITGIKNAVYESSETESRLLNTAVKLLQIISEKNTSFEVDGRELVKVYDERKARNGYSFT